MTEREAMRLLVEANPVRVEDLNAVPMPGSTFARPRRPSRRLTIAMAGAAMAAVAATLIGVFAFGGETGKPLIVPAIPPADVSLVDASALLGAPVVLPDTSFVRPSDAAGTAQSACLPKDEAETFCQITVSFPARGLTVKYVRPGEADSSAPFEKVIQEDSDAKLVSLEGVRALFVPQSESWIAFDIGGTDITVQGGYDEATLQSVAQSIVDQARPASTGTVGLGELPTLYHPLGPTEEPITLADAPTALGAPVVLPDCSFVGPSDASGVWAAGDPSTSSAVAVTFAAQDLIVRYERPPVPDPQSNYYENAVTDTPGSSVIDLNGTPALALAQLSDGSNWGSIEFVADGSTIVVMGHYDEATLQPIAQSILDRSGS